MDAGSNQRKSFGGYKIWSLCKVKINCLICYVMHEIIVGPRREGLPCYSLNVLNQEHCSEMPA